MNIKELKEIITTLPDDLPVCSCCSTEEDNTKAVIKTYWDWEADRNIEYLWVGFK